MKHKIKYSKDLEWLMPFVESVNTYIPLHSIKSIKSYKVKEGLNERTYGSTIKRKKKYTINLRVYHYDDESKTYKNEIIAMILDTLAHELSHVNQGNKNFGKHDYKHFRIQSWILNSFSVILEKLKVDDTSKRFNN